MSKNFMDYDNATSLFTKLKTVLGKKAELKDTMTRADYEDAQNLTAGVYPIEGDADLTVISADMVEYGNGTVKDALDQGTGGSTVTWQQLQVTGDKIAEITVSGVKQDVFSHSIVVSRMQMSGTHIADITIDGVKNEIFAPNGGSGGGHTIENAAGTDLTQRDTLQFTGALKATDDSSNSKTVVTDDADTYTWEQWNQLTPQQRAAIPKALVTGAPGVDGGIDATLFTKLWENPSPTSSFAAQDITLASDDYDFLLIFYKISYGANSAASSLIYEKGIAEINLFYSFYNSGSYTRNREFHRNSDISYSFGDATQNGTVRNESIIPLYIYGIKKTINLQFSAIASDISTSADKCMLEDGVTSVQDAIDAQPTYTFLGESNQGGWNSTTITSLANFKYIMIVVAADDNDRLTQLVPVTYFRTKNANNNYIGGYTYVTSTVVVGYGAFYYDDTTVYLNMSNTSYYIKIYGVN